MSYTITEMMVKEKFFLALEEYYTVISKWMKGDVCFCNSYIVLQSQIKQKSTILRLLPIARPITCFQQLYISKRIICEVITIIVSRKYL